MKQTILKEIKEQYFADLATTRDLTKCFDGLRFGNLKWDELSMIFRSIPLTAVRDFSLLYNSEAGNKEVEVMAKLKDLRSQIQTLMELKLKFLNYFDYF